MKILRKTIKKAFEHWSPHPLIRCYHYAAAFDGNKMIGFARNNPIKMSRKAHRIGQQFNIPTYVEHSYPHAESHLVSQLLDRYNSIDPSWTIVVLRINKIGLMLGSKPCDNCAKILNAVGLNDVYWSVLNNVFQSDDREITIDHDYFCKYAKGIYLDENTSELLNT